MHLCFFLTHWDRIHLGRRECRDRSGIPTGPISGPSRPTTWRSRTRFGKIFLKVAFSNSSRMFCRSRSKKVNLFHKSGVFLLIQKSQSRMSSFDLKTVKFHRKPLCLISVLKKVWLLHEFKMFYFDPKRFDSYRSLECFFLSKSVELFYQSILFYFESWSKKPNFSRSQECSKLIQKKPNSKLDPKSLTFLECSIWIKRDKLDYLKLDPKSFTFLECSISILTVQLFQKSPN